MTDSGPKALGADRSLDKRRRKKTMAKARNAVQIAMTLATAIVITLETSPAWAGPWGWVKRASRKALDAYEAQGEGMIAEAHWKQFVSSIGLRDLVGRSVAASLVMALIIISVSFILQRRWKEQHWMSIRVLAAYFLSLPAGFFYEYFSTANTQAGTQAATSIMGLAGLLLVTGLFAQWRLFAHFVQACRKKQVGYYLLHRRLFKPQAAPSAAQKTAAPEAPQAAPSAAQKAATEKPVAAPQAAVTIRPAPPRRALPPVVICPTCHQQTLGGAPFCGICGALMSSSEQGSTQSPPVVSSPSVCEEEAEEETSGDLQDYWMDNSF